MFAVPIKEWLARGNRSDLAWKVYVAPAELVFSQRLSMGISVDVPGKPLAKLGEKHELHLMVRFSDEHGHEIDEAWIGRKIEKAMPRNTSLNFWMPFYVIPGNYNLDIVLYDRTTNRYNVHRQAFHVKPLKNDPLPQAFSSLPRVQFRPAESGLNANYGAQIRSRLALPVATKRPLHFEIVFVLGELEQRSIRSRSSFTSLGFGITALRVLSQMQLKNAAFHITAVDPLRREILFEQKTGQQVNWPAMNQAIGTVNPGVISMGALEGYRENAMFLREVFAQRIAEPLATQGGQHPLKVFLLLGSPMLFPPGTGREPIEAEDDGDTLFFQIRRQPFARYKLFDDLDKVLKPLSPKRFDIAEPWDFRKALAEIIRAIEQHSEKPVRRAGTSPSL